jgi:hypothetical protein
MKKVMVYFLLALLLFQNSGRLVVLAWFKLYQPEITRTLCVNRSRPQLHCDGKCVLAKKMAAAEKQQETAGWERLVEIAVFTAPSVFRVSFPPPVEFRVEPVRFAYQQRPYISPSIDFFRPPRV